VSLSGNRYWTGLFLALWVSAQPAVASDLEFQPSVLKSIDCRVQVPVGWSIYDRSSRDCGAWVITPDDLNKADYKTGVKIDALLQVESRTGVKASKWVAARICDKSTSLPVISSETGPTNDYFQVKRLVTEEVYSPGRTEYTTCRITYSWFWNDKQDVVICMEARAPEKAWKSTSGTLEKIGKLGFDVMAWKKKLATAEE
jgi:hypothetical protein